MAILASARAQLLLMQRRIIEALAKQRGWFSGWAAIQATRPLADVDLDGKEEVGSGEAASKTSTSSAEIEKIAQMLLSSPLLAALASMEDFRAAYEVIMSYPLHSIC